MMEEKLKALVFFHRHGARSPEYFMPNDQVNNGNWTRFEDQPIKGMLTRKGANMLHSLGVSMRQRYLIDYNITGSDTFERKVYVARSTDFDRTIESAQELLLGFFDGLPNRFQSVPIHVMPKSIDDILLAYKGRNCPRLVQLQDEVMKSPEWQQIEKENEAYFQKVSQIGGYPPGSVNLRSIGMIFDPLRCEKEHGMPWIEGFRQNPDLFEKSAELIGYITGRLYAGQTKPEIRRFAAGNMIAQVIARFQRKVGLPVTVPMNPSAKRAGLDDGSSGDFVPTISHFSAHDTTIAALLGGLDKFDDINPPYGSTVVFELVESGHENFVRAFYNRGVERPFKDGPLDLCKGNNPYQLCPLEEFIEQYSHMVPKDYDKECTLEPIPQAAYNVCFPIWVLIVTLAPLLLWAVTKSRKGKQQDTKKHDVYETEPLNH